MINLSSKHIWFYFGVGLILTGVVFASFYKLSESPQTWTDEGLIVQTAQNLTGQGIYGFQIAPGEVISPSFISTSFPVTYPISLSFKLFGTTLFSARIVMAIYIIFLFISVFALFREKIGEKLIWTLLLFGSFPPIYGHGKNVLGEIPGLFFVLLSAIFLKKIEEGKHPLINFIMFGLSAGIAVSTKPIFILIIPGFVFVLFRLFRNKLISLKGIGVVSASFLIPILAWLNIQFFESDGWSSVLLFYSNPHSLDLIPAIIANLKDFLTHTRTLFAGGVFGLWTVALLFFYYKGRKFPLFQVYLYVIALLVFVLYFRNPPYYRYFFITEALSVVFLAFNLFYFDFQKVWVRNCIRFFIFLLLSFQFYQLGFQSWVSDSYKSDKTKVLQENLSNFESYTQIFVYDAPETVLFLNSFNYYQYFSGTKNPVFGADKLALLDSRNDLLVLTRQNSVNEPLLSDYRIVKEFHGYVILQKKF